MERETARSLDCEPCVASIWQPPVIKRTILQTDTGFINFLILTKLFCTFVSFLTGAKEIDIAATVEHLRDQRPSMVKTKVSKQHTF